MQIGITKKQIEISKIKTIHGADYYHAKKMEKAYIEAGKKWIFPPIMLVRNMKGDGYYCIDGIHRTRTRKRLGFKKITAYVLDSVRISMKDVREGNVNRLWQCSEFVDKDGNNYLNLIKDSLLY